MSITTGSNGQRADVALRTVRDYLIAGAGIERVTFVLRPSAVDTFRRRLAGIS